MNKFFASLLLSLISLTAAAQKHAEWVKTLVFYHIYPSSFKDSDGNGIGHLKGIEVKLIAFSPLASTPSG